eukprot:scaffold254746_cov28-Tisochrysis_lutea.AAC.2
MRALTTASTWPLSIPQQDDHGRHPHPGVSPNHQVPRRQRRQGAPLLPPRPPEERPGGQVLPGSGRPAPLRAPRQGRDHGARLHRRGR